MRKLLLLLLLSMTLTYAYASPDNTMSIAPAATDGSVITAADENTRNASISTPFNAHGHTDVSQVGNTLSVGDGTAGDKIIRANTDDASKPFIEWDDTVSAWVSSRDGTNDQTIVVVSGVNTTRSILPLSPTDEDILRYDSGVDRWISEEVKAIDIGTLTRDTSTATGTQSVNNLAFQPTHVLFTGAQSSSVEATQAGFDDASVQSVMYDDSGVLADSYVVATGTGTDSLFFKESGSDIYKGKINQFTSDGFDIGWTKVGTPTGTVRVNYMAYR